MKKNKLHIVTKAFTLFLCLTLTFACFPALQQREVDAKETKSTLELEEGTYDESQIIVKFKDSVESETVEDVLDEAESVKSKNECEIDKIDEKLAGVDVASGKTVEEAIYELEADPRVEYAEPNYIATLAEDDKETSDLTSTRVSDPQVGRQWYVSDENAKVFQAWDVAKCDGKVSIAYIDSGIDTDHPDLVDNVVASHSTISDNVEDTNGHGTAVAGVLSARTNNSLGVAGISYNANLVPIKAFEGETAGLPGIIKGIKWAIDNASTYNIKVINMSLGFKLESENTYTRTMREYINEAYDKGILCVCASGNDARLTGVSFPASIESTIAVGSIDSSHTRALSSNGGDDLDVVAPGVDIFTTIKGGSYSNRCWFGDKLSEVSGTSFASPFVAAAAALCFAANTSATPSFVKTAITSTAKDLGTTTGKDAEYGAGQVVVSDAVSKVKNSTSSREMWRLYNPYTGEHFYTSGAVEKQNVVDAGWEDEGTGWTAPTTSNTPVFRLYNRYAGDHHYTTDGSEKERLVNAGWEDEGTGWYSDDSKKTPLYRQYNPNATAGAHNFTTNVTENNNLKRLGWREEGIAWYGL